MYVRVCLCCNAGFTLLIFCNERLCLDSGILPYSFLVMPGVFWSQGCPRLLASLEHALKMCTWLLFFFFLYYLLELAGGVHTPAPGWRLCDNMTCLQVMRTPPVRVQWSIGAPNITH